MIFRRNCDHAITYVTLLTLGCRTFCLKGIAVSKKYFSKIFKIHYPSFHANYVADFDKFYKKHPIIYVLHNILIYFFFQGHFPLS